MGREKAGLIVDGTPLLQRAASLLATVAAEVLISARRETSIDMALLHEVPVRLVFDERAEGPLAGLETSLEAAGHPVAVVVPLDMPRLTPALLAGLIEAIRARPEAGAAVYVLDGAVLPLPAVFRRTALPVLKAQLDRGDLRVRKLIESLDAIHLEPPRADVQRGAFSNVNSPADLGLPG